MYVCEFLDFFNFQDHFLDSVTCFIACLIDFLSVYGQTPNYVEIT